MSLFLIRQQCGFSETDFADFRRYMTRQLQEPKNNVGLRGVGQNAPVELREVWGNWLDWFIDNDIGEYYWGQGTARIWCYPADRSKQVSQLSSCSELEPKTNNVDRRIRDFVKTAVMLISRVIRNESKVISTPLPPSNNNFPTPANSPLERALTVEGVAKQRKRNLQECVSDLSNLSTKLGSTGISTTFILEDDPRKQKRMKFGNPTIIDIDSDSDYPAARGATVSSDPPPTSRSMFVEKLSCHPLSSYPQDQPDLVLETTITGSSEIRLIYCPKNHPLSCFVRGVHRKYGLSPDQEIVGIKVKIGHKIFNVDLKECRDWMYISGVITKNGGKAEMVVSIK